MPDPYAEIAAEPAMTVPAPVPVQTQPLAPLPGAYGSDPNFPSDPYGDIAHVAADAPQTGALPVSESLGFEKNLMKPLSNMETWLGKIPYVGTLTGADDPNMLAAHQRAQAWIDRQAQSARPGQIGGVLGSILGTAPTLAIPGGPLVQGAAAGAMMTDDPNKPMGVLKDAALGGVGGKLFDMGGKAVLDTIAPRIVPSAQRLLAAGVPLTTDMMTGGKGPWGLLGKFASVMPVSGELYRARGNEALAAASPGFANEAMASISPNIGPVDSGSALFDAAKNAKNAAYRAVGDGLNVPLDGAYAARMQPVRGDVAGLPPDLQGRYARVVGRELNLRVDPTTGEIPSAALADAKVGINKDIAKFPNPSGWDADYVDALKSTRRALVDSLGDTSPQARQALDAADAAYPGYKTVQSAVRKANLNSTTQDAFPTAQHMLSAVRENSSPDAFAAGTAPGQQFAQAAKDILPRKFKDVMSLGHAVMETGIGAGVIGTDVLGHAGLPLLAGVAGLAPLYSRAAQGGLRRALSATGRMRTMAESMAGPLEHYTGAASALGGGAVTPAAGSWLDGVWPAQAPATAGLLAY